MVKRAILFINGDLADVSQLHLKKTDFLIGIDGGTVLAAKLGWLPDVIIGDLDSLAHLPAGVPVIRYPADKDFTDTELAVEFCQKLDLKEIILVGFLGRRLDHLIANLFLSAKFNLTIYEGDQILFFVSTKTVFQGEAGSLVSLIPLSDCVGVSTGGLKWPLRGDSLKVGASRGISNVMTAKKARISLKKGKLLVVYNCS